MSQWTYHRTLIVTIVQCSSSTQKKSRGIQFFVVLLRELTSHPVCINLSLEWLGPQECYHSKINVNLHFESSFEQDKKKFVSLALKGTNRCTGALTDFVPRVSLLSLLSGTGRENLEHKVGAGHVARAFVLRMLPKIPLTRTNSQISVHFTRGGNETFIRFNGSST